MNNKFKYAALAGALLIGFIVSSCNDIDDLVVPQYNRLFSPTELEARISNRTSVRLSWVINPKVTAYGLQILVAGDESETIVREYTVEPDEIPYMVSELEGETEYVARIKAISKNTSVTDSKWSTINFTTDSEQIFNPLDPNDLEATQVTLRWPAGQTATNITVTPGDINYIVTADDIAAGAATITGLTGETQYTAKLMNGVKTRGTMIFTTPLNLEGAIAVTVDDDLVAMVEAAEEGDVFALFPGEYTVATLNVSKSIGIKSARPGNKPVLKSTIIHMKAGAGLELSDLVLDGTGSDGNQTIVYDDDLTDGVYGALIIDNCEISNYTKGAIYVNKKCNIVSVSITNTMYSNIECDGGDFIDFRSGIAQKLEFTNNTVYNSALARDFFRMDAGGSNNFPAVNSIINISNNTFNNVSNAANRRMLYIRLKTHEITFNKNILANTIGYYTNQAATTVKEMKDNNYFNAPNFTASTQNNAYNDAGTYTTLDPGFKDAANGDFTLSNDDLIFNEIGDKRWR